MFSQLVFVRLRAAEKALRDGRLDEAFRLASAADLKDHRRAIDVRSSLAEKFLARAREHFRADRFREAMTDLERAEAGHSLMAQVAELRDHVQTVMNAMHGSEKSQRVKLDEAKRRIESGSLAAGQKILEAVAVNNRAAEGLRHEIINRASEVKEIVAQVERLLKDRQYPTAASRLLRAKTMDAHFDNVLQLEHALCAAVFESVRGLIASGRLARASDELRCLGDLGRDLPAKRELDDVLELARKASLALAANEFDDARKGVLSMQRLMPHAKWLAVAAEQLRQVDENYTALQTGPLGERVGAANGFNNKPTKAAALDDTVIAPSRNATDSNIPNKLLLLVDGGGSYLILRGSSASIGRLASERPADVALVSDLSDRHASVARVEEDYFLFSEKDIEVGGRKTQRHLLRDGDRITLGRRAKLTFQVPTRQSSTAVLDLSETSKMPHDVRRVVLMHRTAMIGHGSTAHIRCRHAGTTLVMFERNGELWVRPKSDGHVSMEAKPLRLGEPMEIAGVSLVLSPWQIRATGNTNT